MINYLNPSQKVNAKFVTLHGSIACCENELDVRTLVSRMARAVSASKEGVVHNRSFFVILTTDSFEALFISYFKPAGIR